MQWTDRIRQVKIILVIVAIVIAVVSLVASNILTKDLAREERSKMEVWAEAMRALSQADENTDLAKRNRCMIEVLYGCGLRVSELTELQISNINFKENYLKIQ